MDYVEELRIIVARMDKIIENEDLTKVDPKLLTELTQQIQIATRNLEQLTGE